MKFPVFACLAVTFTLTFSAAAQTSAQPGRHNIIIFVADGLRYGSVEPANMPNMARLKTEGVDFTNSHSLYPTLTTVNASAIATGHGIGDTGDFANTIYTAKPLVSLKGSQIGFLENDTVLAEMNQLFGGNYLNETTLIAAARAGGWQTAVIGKEGPARIQDSTASQDGTQTVIVDDSTGQEGALGLPSWFQAGLKAAAMQPAMPKTSLPNIEQEVNMMKAATRIVLPHFQQIQQDSGKPFIMLFWSRDPDASQHATRDSLGELYPGINGPSGKAGTRNADSQLGELLAALKKQGLDKTTDIFITADHGFATVSHASATSPSARQIPGTLAELGSGFLAADLGVTLGLPMRNPGQTGQAIDIANGGKLSGGSAVMGRDPAHPDLVVASNGGSDLLYLPGAGANALANRIVEFLAAQDYVSGIFVNDRLGKIAGTLPMSTVGLIGSAATPQPDIYVNFRSFAQGCDTPLQCTVAISDTPLLTGQGNHGGFSRAETRNFMAAIGPDFRKGFADPAPISNADIAPTLARLMGLNLVPKGKLAGRVLTEALAGGPPVSFQHQVIRSAPGPGGVVTLLNEQVVGSTRYFDAAGFPGKTVGLSGP